MKELFRFSPVRFDHEAVKTVRHDGWSVVTEYSEEGDGPGLVDLSHLKKWDYQHDDLDAQTPLGLAIPAEAGEVSLQGAYLVSRLGHSQATIWQLQKDESAALAIDEHFTEMTDAHCMLAVVGTQAPVVMEHVSNLDLFRTDRKMPFLTQGPVMHIPAQVVTLLPECVLMTFSRGYGQSFADAMMHAASGCGLRPSGEDAFHRACGAV